jgi:predicted SprT family Zn-dependent metalloprotease
MRKTVSTTKRRIKAVLRALNLDLFRPDVLVRPAPATLYTKIRESARRLPDLNSISLTVSPNHKQSDAQLHALFDRYNWMYFDGKLPRVRLIWSSRMMSAGSYSPTDRTIRISRKYHAIFPDELDDTVKHEMIHILHLNHDAAFKREAKRVGASLRAQSHPSLRKPPKFTYSCSSCGTEYPRQKRIRLASCGKCSRGRFDERHKLRLKR